MANFFANAPISSWVPMPKQSTPPTVKQIDNYQKKWRANAKREFFERISQTGYLSMPVTPAINDSKATMQFISKPTHPRLRRIAESPLTTYTGPALQAHIRKERLRAKGYLPTDFQNQPPPIMARIGPTSTFKSGTGVGVDKYLPLQFLRKSSEESLTQINPNFSTRDLMTVSTIQLRGDCPTPQTKTVRFN